VSIGSVDVEIFPILSVSTSSVVSIRGGRFVAISPGTVTNVVLSVDSVVKAVSSLVVPSVMAVIKFSTEVVVVLPSPGDSVFVILLSPNLGSLPNGFIVIVVSVIRSVVVVGNVDFLVAFRELVYLVVDIVAGVVALLGMFVTFVLLVLKVVVIGGFCVLVVSLVVLAFTHAPVSGSHTPPEQWLQSYGSRPV